MTTNNSVLTIVPAAHVTAANTLCRLLGFGPTHFGPASSATGYGEKEYYYSNWENMPEAAEAAMRDLKNEIPPLTDDDSPWGEDGMPTYEEAQAAAGAIDYYVRGGSKTAEQHKDAVLALYGQQVWKGEEPEPEEG